MNVRAFATAALLGTTIVGVAACGNDHLSTSPATGAVGGHCSDPKPSALSLTFAGVVCVLHTSRVAQPDGSVELELKIAVTDKDPNAFGVRTWDFALLDTAGHDIDADDAKATGRRGADTCVYQDLSDDGWPVQPGATFSIPGPVCFNLSPGEHPTQLVWQGDVSVPLSS